MGKVIETKSCPQCGCKIQGYILDTSIITELTAKLTAKDEQIDGLRGALGVSLVEMILWRDSDICDCDGNGHTCGLPRLKQSIAEAREALAKSVSSKKGTQPKPRL